MKVLNLRHHLLNLCRVSLFYYYLLIMDNQESRNFQEGNKLMPTSKEQHLNLVYMPYEKTLQAVPYYARKKRELKSKNYALNKEDEFDRLSSKLSIDLEGSKETKTQKNFRSMIMEITVEPVINDNKFTNFDPSLYPLQQHEKVKVVEEKYFPLQNYYNYIWAVKSSEEIFRIAQQTEKKAQAALFNFIGEFVDGDYDESHKKGPLIKQTMKIKGIHESRFNPYSSTKRVKQNGNQDSYKELAPIHRQYKQGYPKNSPFSIKQAERMSIIKGQLKQQPKFRY